MIENIKKNIISIIIAVIVTPFVAGIYFNTKEVPKVKEDVDELKTEVKELKKEFADYQKEQWERYVDMNTKTFNNSNRLRK
jgi:cell division protein FtsL